MATVWGGSGGEATVASKQRWRKVSCFLARAAKAAGEGFNSDVEAWRDEANKLKEALKCVCENVSDMSIMP